MVNGLDDFRNRIWHWSECQDCREEMKMSWPRTEPPKPELGQGWYDERGDCLYVWDGDEWVCVPSD